MKSHSPPLPDDLDLCPMYIDPDMDVTESLHDNNSVTDKQVDSDFFNAFEDDFDDEDVNKPSS